MVRPIMKDMFFLGRKSQPATKEDLPVAIDLMDTLNDHRAECVGMAANMIGVLKNIIIFDNEGTCTVMFNPEITAKSGPYTTKEGCLSLTGQRETTRYQTVKVKYQDMDFRPKIGTFSGWTAQIIQHEIDHCNGIII